MPIDRANPITPRPLKPTLASHRTAKTPITPRLAVASATSATAATTPTTTRSSNGTTSRAYPAAAQEHATPAKALLSSNVTPRSSSRKSRVGFDNTSPNTTTGGPPRLPPSAPYRQSPSDAGPPRDVASLFFRADDVRPNDQPAPPPQKKAPTFFHASARQDDLSRNKNAPSPPLSSLGKSQPEAKFFHADSLSEPRSRPPILTPPPISASPEPLPPNNAAGIPLLRPASPSKEWSHMSYRKGASQVGRPALVSRNSGTSASSSAAGSNLPDRTDLARRKSSATQSTVRFGHSKSASLSSIESVTELRRVPATEQPTMIPSPLHIENEVVSEAPLHDSVVSASSPPMPALSSLSSPAPMSPTAPASGKSALETMNELAANARRERKVLDLEISNSSLLAINRSLEKEVRKQKAELRRFRRLSRAGRFSMDIEGSTSESFRATSADRLAHLSDMSEDEEEAEGGPVREEEEPDDSESSHDEGSLSSAVQAERDESHRLRDEKRLEVDLSKHRELLIDSQKMNQSLKRCLGWTEQLIKDGQRALEYKVHVNDVKVGGRVLVAEDDCDDAQAEESRGLLSPWSPLHSVVDAPDLSFFTDLKSPISHDGSADAAAVVPVEHGADVPLPPSPTRMSRSPDKDFRPHVPGRWESFATATRPSSGVLDDLPALGSPFEEKLRDLHASIDAMEAS